MRLSKSFKLAPGVRMTVSRSGVGYSVGGGGVRVTRRPRGGHSRTVGIPGSGISHTRTLDESSRRTNTTARTPVLPGPAKPGPMAPGWEKALFRLLVAGSSPKTLEAIAAEYPTTRPLCMTLDGLLAYQRGDRQRARLLLHKTLLSGFAPEADPFVIKYIAASQLTISIADGVAVEMPLCREAVGLALAELHQDAGDLAAAIAAVEALPGTGAVGISAAELYCALGSYGEVINMTEEVRNDDDAGAFLLVMRGIALRETGHHDAAKDCLTDALRSRSRAPEVRHRALIERAQVHLDNGRIASARRDLERILAEDSSYPGLTEALALIRRDSSS